MCGVTGFFTPSRFRPAEAEATLVAMRDCLVHRGPDDAGIWLDAAAGIALGHRRLSILDLSPAGHQPMVSASGRYVLAFNGEIYNYQDIRRQLELATQTAWRGHSDTESLLAAIDLWGLERALKETVGMFALALWDRQERVLSLARDRMGEKPLYYGWQRGVLLFGSELKALTVHPAFESIVERDVLPLYLRHGYIPAPWCVWRGIRKLMPGTVVNFCTKDLGTYPEPQPYWSFYSIALHGQAEPFVGQDKEAIDALETSLSQAVAGQMIADVPLGAFLSGGVDSSTIVALMQAQSSQRVKTFTIGFAELGYDESAYARTVAQHLGTDHTELIVTADRARDVIPKLPNLFDEPFGDSSSIPTYLVSCLAREQVVVSLSGDGGDELFGGYRRYHKAALHWRLVQTIPTALRKAGKSLLKSQAPRVVEELLHPLMCGLKRPLTFSIAAKASLAADLLESETQWSLYQSMISQWNPQPVVQQSRVLSYGLHEVQQAELHEPLQRMMAQDSITYLPDDILVKVDRAAMAISLESRVPLLDHRVVELAWRMPYHMKVRNGQGKWLLRQVLCRYVPEQLIERPKMGFGVPVDNWLRGPLREWAEHLLSQDRLEREGFLDSHVVRTRWREHLQSRHNWRDSLWLVLMWQAWLESYERK